MWTRLVRSASSTRREPSTRRKISRSDVDVTERERFKVRSGRPEPAVDVRAARDAHGVAVHDEQLERRHAPQERDGHGEGRLGPQPVVRQVQHLEHAVLQQRVAEDDALLRQRVEREIQVRHAVVRRQRLAQRHGHAPADHVPRNVQPLAGALVGADPRRERRPVARRGRVVHRGADGVLRQVPAAQHEVPVPQRALEEEGDVVVVEVAVRGLELLDGAVGLGDEQGATFPEAPISAAFHSFRLMFGRAIISRSALEARMLRLEHAEHSSRS